MRKTPEGREPFDPTDVQRRVASAARGQIGMIAYYLVDPVAEHYLTSTDRLNDDIDELEDHVDDWPAQQIRERISVSATASWGTPTLAPSRDAVRGSSTTGSSSSGDETVRP